MRTLIRGIGINDADYVTHDDVGTTCQYYRIWKGMLDRSYEKGTPITEGWHRFSTFKAWMETQDWEGKELDKDLLGHHTIGYSPETCCFLPRSLNSFMQDRRKTNSVYPIGVSATKTKYGVPRYKAFACADGGQNYLGVYDTPEQAHEAWRVFKESHAKVWSERLKSEGYPERVCTALLTRYNI